MIDLLIEVGKTLLIGAFFGTLVGLYLVINKKLEEIKNSKKSFISWLMPTSKKDKK